MGGVPEKRAAEGLLEPSFGALWGSLGPFGFFWGSGVGWSDRFGGSSVLSLRIMKTLVWLRFCWTVGGWPALGGRVLEVAQEWGEVGVGGCLPVEKGGPRKGGFCGFRWGVWAPKRPVRAAKGAKKRSGWRGGLGAGGGVVWAPKSPKSGESFWTYVIGPMLYTLFPCFPWKRVYTVAFLLCDLRVGRQTEKGGAPRWWCMLFCLVFQRAALSRRHFPCLHGAFPGEWSQKEP